MKQKLIISSVIVYLFLSCAPYEKTVFDEDFLDGQGEIEPGAVADQISAVRTLMRASADDPALYRRLCVLYRLQGTPYSRSRSIEAIEKAILLEPDNPLNHIEKGLTFHAMQFTGESEESFREAIKLDPGSFHAWYYLAQMKKEEYLENMCFTEELKNALRFYKKAYDIDNRHGETIFNLGFLHMFRRMDRTARKYSSILLELYPDDPRSWLLSASVSLRFGDFARAEERFNRALEMMKDREKIYYVDTAPLLSPEIRDDYLTWPEDIKKDWNRRFWFTNDPTIATDINERLLEHYERVFFARELLTLKRLGIDGAESVRGQALISYGLPDKLLYDIGHGTDGPIVVWEYSRSESNFRLYFQDEFLNGNYHIPIDPAYSRLSGITQSIFDNLPQAYQYPVEYLDAPFHIQISQNRGPGEKTDIEFAIALPDSVIDDPKNRYCFCLVAYDNNLERILDKKIELRPDTLDQMEKSSGRYFLCGLSALLAARIGECVFGIEFSGGRPLRRGTWRDTFEIRSLGSGSLKTSTIRFLLDGKNGDCLRILDPIPVYDSGNDLCIAYDIYNLKRNEDDLSRYRVTYSIRRPAEDGSGSSGIKNTLYWIKRSIRGDSGERSPYISSSLEQSVNSSEASDMIRISIGSLEPGKYLLLLQVEDLTSGGAVSEENIFVVSG
ncbi:MAG: GWxTD domain-containing protein [Candidatus Krumholzibacteriota bacterium]|nr:GWxTD domain-containing protein [Candidatus Krumholzibacteriota bacterium]